MITKTKLITKQALKIYDLETRLDKLNSKLRDIHILITNIGAPLNDNINHYNEEQLKIFFKIQQIIEE